MIAHSQGAIILSFVIDWLLADLPEVSFMSLSQALGDRNDVELISASSPQAVFQKVGRAAERDPDAAFVPFFNHR